MPYKDPDASDPMLFVGVSMPGSSEQTEEMAYTFAEEFARMGYSVEKILHLFSTPFYRAAYGAYQALGEEAIRKIVEECVNIWGRVRFVARDSGNEAAELIPPESIEIESGSSPNRNIGH
jgi:hypothetical protein